MSEKKYESSSICNLCSWCILISSLVSHSCLFWSKKYCLSLCSKKSSGIASGTASGTASNAGK